MTKEKIIAAYEELAESYNAQIDYKPHNAYYDRPNTLTLFPDVKGKSILDAACGPGKYAEILISKGASVTGVDISPKMIALARERNRSSGTFLVHDLDKPLSIIEKNSFDIVLSALAMHHLKDWSNAIREFYRVLKPKGYMILSMEHPFFDYNYFRSKDYFNVEAVKCTWHGFDKPVEIHSFRRPLQECIDPIVENGFYIDKIIEPRPVAEFEKSDPKHYKELNEFPAFMCLRALRRD